MLFCNANVVIAIGEALFKLDEARSLAHGRCDAHQQRIGMRHIAQPLTKYLRKGLLGITCFLNALGGIKFTGAVIQNRIGFCQHIPLALTRDHMQKLWAAAFQS